MSTGRPYEILLVEDNTPDIELILFLLSDCGVPIHFSIAKDGKQGSDFVFRRNTFASSPTPDLILLDLNLPRKDGRELLQEIRAAEDLCRIPIIVISTSSSYREISEVYCLGASCFISKPTDITEFKSILHSLVDFWLRRIELPTRISRRL